MYANVKPNPKQEGSKSRTRYDFVQEGKTVGDCARHLLDHYVKEGLPEFGFKEIQRICADIGHDTYRSFYKLICPFNCDMRR